MRDIHPFDRRMEAYIFPFCILLTLYVAGYVIAIPLGMKIIDLYGLTFAGGYIAASFTYPCTDIAGEIYGKRAARWIVTCGIIGILIMIFLIEIDMRLPSSEIWQTKDAFNTVFGFQWRLILGGLAAFILGQYLDVYIFAKVRQATGSKHLWLRNNVSTVISKFIDISTFHFVSFYGVYSLSEIIEFTLEGYVFYMLLALLDTPLVYLGVKTIRKLYPQLR